VEDIFDLEPETLIDRNDSFIISYPHILNYFSSLTKISEGDLVRGAHMIYGWMPTILHLHTENRSLKRGAEIMTGAKSGTLSGDDITYLKDLINHSAIGTSKLLHFVAPSHYAIWDSNVCYFVHGFKDHSKVNNVGRYLEYVDILKSLKKNGRFKAFHASVNKKVGHRVSALRALELTMFSQRGS
jgi:hypothetical protein